MIILPLFVCFNHPCSVVESVAGSHNWHSHLGLCHRLFSGRGDKESLLSKIPLIASVMSRLSSLCRAGSPR